MAVYRKIDTLSTISNDTKNMFDEYGLGGVLFLFVDDEGAIQVVHRKQVLVVDTKSFGITRVNS